MADCPASTTYVCGVHSSLPFHNLANLETQDICSSWLELTGPVAPCDVML